MAARNSLIEAQRLERDILLKSYSESVVGDTSSQAGSANGAAPAAQQQHHNHHTLFRKNQASNLSEEDQQVVAASSEATRGLHRLRDNIEKALLVSTATHENLEESSAAMAQVGESYMSLDTMLASSRELLATLVKSQKSDTWYLQTSMYMLLATLGWLVFRRWMYGPLWWLVWLPLRVMFRTSVGVGSAVVGSGGGASAPEEVVVREHVASVEGLPDETLPTVKVAQEERDDTKPDPDSMVEKVGRIVDEEKGDSATAEVSGDILPEEDTLVKDEL